MQKSKWVDPILKDFLSGKRKPPDSIPGPTHEEMVERAERNAKYIAEESAGLQPYDKDRRCPKCEFPHATTRFRPIEFLFLTDVGIPVKPRRMVRTCPNCQYGWDERPVDENNADRRSSNR